MAADVKRFIGGYATTNLSPEERRQLLQASLDDQEVFDALVYEEMLREAIVDGGGRALALEVFGELDTHTETRPWWAFTWVRGLAFGAAVAAIAAAVIVYRVPRTDDAASQVARHDWRPIEAPVPERPVGVAPSTPATAVARLDQWIVDAPVTGNDSAFQPSGGSGASAAGVDPKGADLPALQFVADRIGFAAVFTLRDDGSAQRAGDWIPVRGGQAIALSTADGSREIRVVVVEGPDAPSDDAAAIAAVQAGRGLVFVHAVAGGR